MRDRPRRPSLSVELQDIVQQYGVPYLQHHPSSPEQRRALRDIAGCRTAALGGHVDGCDTCGLLQISYNSCRNRHCPKCQTVRQLRWVAARAAELLDHTGYFHVVFTLPDRLNVLALQNPRLVYGLLFRTAAETLQELAADPKYLGATIGMTAVLHTWGQNLQYHPHLHGIVPGGGLTPSGQWRHSRKKFFLPVKVLSRKFRGKFLALLRAQLPHMVLSGPLERLRDVAAFDEWLAPLSARPWVVYCKPPFANASRVIAYLGRYTHRVAISNARILHLEDGQVTFRWRDSRDGNRQKAMTLSAEEFLRRFLLHVLPPGFTRIRHYGFLSPRNKSTQLVRCQRLTRTAPRRDPIPSNVVLLQERFGRDVTLCPACRQGHFQPIRAAPVGVPRA